MKVLGALFGGLLIGCFVFVLPRLSAESTPPTIQSLPTIPTSMTVGNAYAAIPHRRTKIHAERLAATPEERDYLELTFRTIDRAVLLRVTAMRSYQNDNFDPKFISSYDELESFVDKISPPRKLKRYHASVRKAIKSQGQVFRKWQDQGEDFPGEHANLINNGKVKSASSHLFRAYDILMKIYPDASEKNKKAFFDYHCALDFI